jgi:hypothetical protein
LLQAISWNASLCLAPTSAVLFRLAEETRPTLLLDECESLSGEDRQEILSIINSGYKQGGRVPRCEGDRRRQVEFFEVYTPLALAGIKGLNATTEDRTIPLVMQRGTKGGHINVEVNPKASAYTRIRAGCYRLLLGRWRAIRDAYDIVPFPAWLNGRARELWKPLLALTHVADQEEHGLALTPDLLSLAQEHVGERADLSVEGDALIAELADRLGQQERMSIRPGELTEPLRSRLGFRDAPTPEAVATWLKRLGFRRTSRDQKGSMYDIPAEQLAQVAARYAPETTATLSPSSDN